MLDMYKHCPYQPDEMTTIPGIGMSNSEGHPNMSNDVETVKSAIDNVPAGMPHADAIRAVLSQAWVEAEEDVEYWESQGKPHLRTFLKTTPLGLAILDLAESINNG